MTELDRILRAADKTGNGVLITLVNISGSSYRRPGARMIVAQDGSLHGIINGGCFDADITLRAKQVMATKKTELLRYDDKGSATNIFGLGLGCQGVLEMLAEPFESPNDLCVASLRGIRNNDENNARVLVFRSHSSKFHIGDQWIITAGSTIPKTMPEDIFLECGKAILNGESTALSLRECDIFIEIFKPQFRLFIFGAGRDAIPVSKIGAFLGWRVFATDKSPAKANLENFPDAEIAFAEQPEKIISKLDINSNSACLIMSHNLEYDKVILRQLVNTKSRYIGLLGPLRRREKLFSDLAADGVDFPNETLKNIYSPAGLHIAAETPEEIALSIIAEIQAAHNGGDGISLRGKNSALHKEFGTTF